MHATQNPNEATQQPASRRWDGQPETDADRKFFDLRESGYTGWIDQDGNPVADLNAWMAEVETKRAAVLPATGQDGYVLTDAGRNALTEVSNADLWALADAVQQQGVTPDQIATGDRDGEPCLAAVDTGAGEAPGSVPQVLRGAALYLERHGWTQHAYYDPTATIFTPAADMVGAIAMVCYGGPCEAPAQHFEHPGFLDFEEAVLHLDRYLLVENGSESYEFNDVRGRLAADVIRVLRDAATRTCAELIDALRVIDQAEQEVAARVKLLTPGGIWAESADQPTRVEHVDYPHKPGTLYDCLACEAECFCTDGFQCVHCALEAERNSDTAPDGGDGE